MASARRVLGPFYLHRELVRSTRLGALLKGLLGDVAPHGRSPFQRFALEFREFRMKAPGIHQPASRRAASSAPLPISFASSRRITVRSGERLSATMRDDFTKTHQSLDTLPGSVEQILVRPPFPGLAKKANRRTSEAEHRFFITPLEWPFDVVLLHDPANGQRADLHHRQTAEVFGLEHLDASLIAEKNVGLVLQGIFVDRPQFGAQTIRLQCHSIIHIVQVVIIDWGQPGQDDRPPLKSVRSGASPKEGGSVQ
jgi:hypothetical protein